jgi:hypothetical protein
LSTGAAREQKGHWKSLNSTTVTGATSGPRAGPIAATSTRGGSNSTFTAERSRRLATKARTACCWFCCCRCSRIRGAICSSLLEQCVGVHAARACLGLEQPLVDHAVEALRTELVHLGRALALELVAEPVFLDPGVQLGHRDLIAVDRRDDALGVAGCAERARRV